MNAKTQTLSILTILLLSFSLASFHIPTTHSNPDTTLASTELINYGSMTTNEITTFVELLEAQNITLFICRLNTFGEWQSGTSTYIAKTKQIITIANAYNIQVAVDLHTWYTTWDNYFDSSASNYASNRANYIEYVENVLTAFEGSNVYAFMVMNEPQAQTATASENQFILDVISAANGVTDKPVSVRFMGGYSASTGHYSASIDTACDFICRNTYWDARYPTVTVYGSTEAKLLAALNVADTQGKELWITEFGKSKTNPETQRAYVEAFVEWANDESVDAVFCWVSQPDVSGETYNIFSGYTPLPAFYELTNEALPADSYPTYSSRAYNTTIAGDPCLFSCNWTDDDGVDASYFSTNNTGTWVNSSLLDLSGTTWANYTTTLNSTGDVVVQYKWFANDTADQWTTTTTQSFTTQDTNNIPTYSNPDIDTVYAGESCVFSVSWDALDGLSGFIFGTNNTGAWVNETWSDPWAGTPASDDATATKTLNETVGVAVEWRVWTNDTDDDWGDTSGLFLTTEEPPYYFFDSENLYATNVYYFENTYPYLTYSTGVVTSLQYSGLRLTFTVNATGTSQTQVKTNIGSPVNVQGATYTYDSTTDIITLTVTHSSEEEVVVDWGTTPAHNVVRGNINVKQNTRWKTSGNNASFTMGADFTFYRIQTTSGTLWLDKTFTAHYYTRYCIYVVSPDNVSLTVNTWFASTTGTARLTITSPLATTISMGFYSPNLVSASVTGATSQTWNATLQVLTFTVNSASSASFTISATATETLEENVTPENVGVSITDMEGCGNWVFSEESYYTFQAKYWDGNGYDDLDTVKLAFTVGYVTLYDQGWINVSYNRIEGEYAIDSGSGMVNLKAGTVTVLEANAIQVTFSIYFKNTVLDANDVDIYLWCNDTRGASDGWEVGAADYFHIYNLGGASSITSSNEITSPYSLTSNTIADSYVNSSASTTNYGTAASLYTENYVGVVTHRTWLKFIIPGAGRTVSGDVNLYVSGISTEGDSPVVSIQYSIDDSWTENGITWDNQPSNGSSLDNNTISSTGWYSWDVTSVLSFLPEGETVTFCLTMDTVDDQVTFYAREHDGNDPYIHVNGVPAAGRVAGGDVFDLYIYDNTLDYDWVMSNMSFRDLQHVKMLPTFMFNTSVVSGYLEYGLDYCIDDTWLTGINVGFEVSALSSGDEQKIGFAITWRNRGVLVSYEEIYMFHTSNVSKISYCQFWVDLWFNKLNASSTVGGRVNAYYYSMSDSSPWYLRWLTGSNWGANFSARKESMAFMPILDADGNVTNTQNIEMVRLYCKLSTPTKFYIDEELIPIWLQVSNYNVFDLTLGAPPFVGIQTPVFDETKVPLMPQGGFLGAVVSALNNLGTWLNTAFTIAILGYFGMLVNFLDTIAAWAGFPTLFSDFFRTLSVIYGYFVSSISYMLSMLAIFFSATLSPILGSFLAVLAETVRNWLDMFTIFTSFLSGTYTSGLDLYNDFNMSQWITIGAIFYPLYLLMLWESKGMDAVINQLLFIKDIVMTLFGLFINVARFFIELIGRIIESIPIAE